MNTRLRHLWRGPFQLEAHGTTVRRELIAGLTTFVTMAYIVVLNPAILAPTGIEPSALLWGTVLAAVLGTLLMAWWANLPIALAPGMGSNAIFAQVLVVKMGVSWQIGLTMVLINGLLFFVIAMTRWRQKIIEGFPDPIKLGIQISIGCFISWLGLRSAGLIAFLPGGGITLGRLDEPATLLAVVGLLLTLMLMARRAAWALLASMLLVSVAGLFVVGRDGVPLTRMPVAFLALPPFNPGMLFAFDLRGYFTHFALLLPISLYFLISEFFSGTATLFAVTRRAGLQLPGQDIPNARAAFSSDALGTVIGAAAGTTTVTAYAESVAGVEAGGRTGLTALCVAALFAVSIFFWPLIRCIPSQASAAALVAVGVLMLEGIRDIDFSIPENSMTPLLMLVVTLATADLMAGMAAGCFVYTLVAVVRGRWKEISLILLGLDAVFAFYLWVKDTL
ncbi:NCS2 family permease [Xylophilus ampelinus]|uniref:AGZA family xanthine/uracil permease-like MFS transporter n=1 Tax=Xylophilus ampelinus TaxID=54067 RepID=A0A318SKY3_9BURK|nr:NCS2 family permease [Xylophilus ampelinus]MCS4510448.1 NCS2 family permease [Xylophilus ampelinus]PYE77901.1 AGZA family xanthine/uracil permease-like MFS transporter [Xylophilus ampelinus]